MAEISRQKLAKTTAESIAAGDKQAIKRLAAFLVDNNRQNEAELIIRDLESALVSHGTVIADVTTARQLTDKTRQEITKFIENDSGAKQVVLRESVDADVLGGVKIAYGGKLLDATVATKLERLV